MTSANIPCMSESYNDPQDEKLKVIVNDFAYNLRKHGYTLEEDFDGTLTANFHNGKATPKVMLTRRMLHRSLK